MAERIFLQVPQKPKPVITDFGLDAMLDYSNDARHLTAQNKLA